MGVFCIYTVVRDTLGWALHKFTELLCNQPVFHLGYQGIHLFNGTRFTYHAPLLALVDSVHGLFCVTSGF